MENKLNVQLLTSDELKLQNLSPSSREPSGQYFTVIDADSPDDDFNPYKYNIISPSGIKINDRWITKNMWAVAPQGYHWKLYNDKSYFNDYRYELEPDTSEEEINNRIRKLESEINKLKSQKV